MEKILTIKEKMILHATSGISLVISKLIGGILGLSLFFTPIGWSLLLVGIAVITDTLAGRWCASVLAKKESKDVRLEVTSKKTRIGFTAKTLIYMTIILGFFTIDFYMIDKLVYWVMPSFPIQYIATKLLAFIFVLIEADSIDEKLYKAKGIRLRELISSKLKGLRSFVGKVITFKNSINDK
jgi:hypothetical protein